MKAVTAEDEEEYDTTIRYSNPKAYIKSYIAIREYKQDTFKKDNNQYVSHYTTDDFPNCPQTLKDYAEYIKGDEVIP